MALHHINDAQRTFSTKRNRNGAQGARADYVRVCSACVALRPARYVRRIFEYCKKRTARHATDAGACRYKLPKFFVLQRQLWPCTHLFRVHTFFRASIT